MIRWLNSKTLRKKRVIVRVDFNVPIQNGKIQDDFRIKAHLTTLQALLKENNTIVVLTHIGKPDGKKVSALSIRPVAKHLSKLIKKEVTVVPDPFNKRWLEKIRNAKPASIFLVENIRFWKGEERNHLNFAKTIAGLGDVFVQDAFGVIHRPHASVVQLPRLLPSYGGLLLKKELKALSPLVNRPRRPFVVIMGGAKISTKLNLIKRFVKKADKILLGGAIANTALAAINVMVGKSKTEKETMPGVKQIILKNKKVMLPADVKIAKDINSSTSTTKSVQSVGKDEIILDIGPRTQQLYTKELKRAKTIFWNGPLGLVENKTFSKGTLNVAKCLKKIRAHKVVGGGDLIAFFNKYRLTAAVSHLATGGGSTLELIAGEKLPGLKALSR